MIPSFCGYSSLTHLSLISGDGASLAGAADVFVCVETIEVWPETAPAATIPVKLSALITIDGPGRGTAAAGAAAAAWLRLMALYLFHPAEVSLICTWRV